MHESRNFLSFDLERITLGRDRHSCDYVEALLMQILTSLLHFGQLDVPEAKKFDFPKQQSGEKPRATCRTSQGMWSQTWGEIVTQVLPDATNRWRWPVHSNRSMQIPIRVSMSFHMFQAGKRARTARDFSVCFR